MVFEFRLVFGLFFVMNLILWTKGSSGAVPFSTLIALLALWFCVSVPLTFVGAYFGFRKRVNLMLTNVICVIYYKILYSQWNIPYAPIKFHVKFLISLSIRNLFLESLWVVYCLLVAFSSSCFSF